MNACSSNHLDWDGHLSSININQYHEHGSIHPTLYASSQELNHNKDASQPSQELNTTNKHAS